MQDSKALLLASIVSLAAASVGLARESVAIPVAEKASPPATESQQNDLYKDATRLMNEGKWDLAAARFAAVAKVHDSLSPGALYWQAYSLQRLGRRSEASAVASQVGKAYPHSRWVRESEALLIEMGAASAPEDDSDEDLKLLALNHLMAHDEEQGLQALRKFLDSGHSVKLMKNALFVLAQSRSPAAKQLLEQIASGARYPQLQLQAIFDLGLEGGVDNVQTLSRLYSDSADKQVKRKILETYGVARQSTPLLALIRQENDSELRALAIHSLGVGGARQELEGLYKEAASAELKVELLHSMMVAGSESTLARIAATESQKNVRLQAIRALGEVGGKGTGPALLELYGGSTDMQIRRAAAESLRIGGKSGELIGLATKEHDPLMRHYLLQLLLSMDDAAARDYMMKILAQ